MLKDAVSTPEVAEADVTAQIQKTPKTRETNQPTPELQETKTKESESNVAAMSLLSTRQEILRELRKGSRLFEKFSDMQLLFITSPVTLSKQQGIGLKQRVKHLMGMPEL